MAPLRDSPVSALSWIRAARPTLRDASAADELARRVEAFPAVASGADQAEIVTALANTFVATDLSVAELVRDGAIPTVMGNYDQGIGFETGDCGCVYKTDEQRADTLWPADLVG